MKTVLHITEAFGGGVQTAIDSYMKSTKNTSIQHILLAKRRPQDDIGIDIHNKFQQVDIVEGNLFHFFMKAKTRVLELQPDIIHLHSSFAGFLGRFLPKGAGKIIYTPHCYSFERLDISPIKRAIYQNLERIGLSRIDVVAGCSLRECALAQKIGAKKAVYLNNYSEIQTPQVFHPRPPQKENFNAVIVGRVSAQKDPDFLLRTLPYLAETPESKQLKIHWIGGGDKKWTEDLEKAGVKVTGMLDHHEVIKTLESADLYLHTAAWEGMPLTLLEAAKLNIPIILRKISATKDFPYPFLVSSPEEMANAIIHFIRSPSKKSHQSALAFFNQEYTREKQRISLLHLYEENNKTAIDK